MLNKTRLFVILVLLLLGVNPLLAFHSGIPGGDVVLYELLYPALKGGTPFSPPPAIPPKGTPPLEPEPAFPRVTPVPMPAEVKGIYATGWAAGSPALFNRILQFIEATEVNSLVVDIKDDTGLLSYRSTVPLVEVLGAWEKKIPDPQRLLQTLQQKKIYPIARLVVFKDPYLAEKRPDLAVKHTDGGIWRDYKGLAWVDPHAREVWNYNIQIAKEAIKMGFPEIQFDYVRFASDGDLKKCVYPFADGSSKEDVIEAFLQYAREELEPLGAVVSADIFGLACSAPDDLYIGQKLEKIAQAVPVISPMVYPSHYAKGSYGLANPDLSPYETVLKSLQDASRRLSAYPVKLRPWLQDFSLGSNYGPAQIEAQIRAVYDAGVRDWIFWNPSCRYDVNKYVTKGNSPVGKGEGFTLPEEELLVPVVQDSKADGAIPPLRVAEPREGTLEEPSSPPEEARGR
ncbi:MAG: putative glycoside hydrolase [Firmicutes bacterium]|nr:putative glycoside hydrolase [Bacillota bacterium]